MFIVLTCVAVVAVIGVIGLIARSEEVLVTALVLLAVVAVFLSVLIPVERSVWIDEMVRIEEVRRTVENARLSPVISVYELASMQTLIAESNATIMSGKYWAKSKWTNWFVPQDILDVDIIR